MARLSPRARAAVDRPAGSDGPSVLVVDGRPTSLGVDVARSVWQRGRGLLGRREVPTALLLHPCRSVHSLGMRVALEVAYLDADLTVLEVVDLPRWRVHGPRRRAAAVLEAAPGALTSRGVRSGVGLTLGSIGA